MSDQTDPKTGQQVPDTATTYERAKPDQESPSKTLDTQRPKQAKEQDKVSPQAIPKSQKRSE